MAQVTVSGPTPARPGQVAATGTYTYKTEMGGQACSLGFTPADHSLLLSAGAPPASLERLGACLAPLLDAVLRDHPGTPEFDLLLTDRDALVERIDDALDVSPAWNTRTGSPRRGLAAAVIRETVNTGNLARELAGVFAKRGYALSLRTASMITVDPLPRLGGHELPTDIADMEFAAKRL